eukprot:scaffold1633_cov147-Skeletonema_menzelii.AAC.17
MSSYQFELAFRQYVAAFDGTNALSPAEFKTLFDKLHHNDLEYRLVDEKVIGGDGMMHLKAKKPLTRDEKFESHSKIYASGHKVTLIYFRKIGLDCIDTKVLIVKNGEEDEIRRVVHTISDGKAVLSQEIDESIPSKVLGAQCAGAVYKCRLNTSDVQVYKRY